MSTTKYVKNRVGAAAAPQQPEIRSQKSVEKRPQIAQRGIAVANFRPQISQILTAALQKIVVRSQKSVGRGTGRASRKELEN